MAFWSSCRIEIVTRRDGLVFEDDDVDLRIDEQGIELTYWDERGVVVFVGPPSREGHYDLMCRSRPRRATLHSHTDASSFEGSWIEGDERGFWRIDLPNE